ncbi:ileal sodium/bile acid cotransporter-like isoform X2 [Toxorhynchites rutilus septentrionalis]|uniref:ileal sodium/bile acid cotransporter-like isoform X2 n=1 Tax=Toxorhynchites rutilus septentrionalis TaxID=329112 RepID=UPI00247862C8|nr:ileal sodium/bile acid cotransporter-like isoform X2 [Toxorhynchites rutilus septentrionalis]
MACPLLKFVIFLAALTLQVVIHCKAALISTSIQQAVSRGGRLGDDGLAWHAVYDPVSTTIHMNTATNVSIRIEGLPQDYVVDESSIQLKSERNHVASILGGSFKAIEMRRESSFEGGFNITGEFLGTTNLYVEVTGKDNRTVQSGEKLPVTVIREERVIDTVFTASVATLVSILYINFGAALDLPKLKTILVRPIGPAIGFLSQFLFMPLLSYGLGYLLFPNDYELQLGMFFTGVSPAGGASNIWTVVLGGNMNLSVAMTTISTIAAFGMMPLWIFTLGRNIFHQGNLVVPYRNIATFAVGLVVPLGIGLLIQRYSPRTARILVRILKPMSIFLILFIVIFAIITNLYLFELFSWQIIVAGLGLPWIGYLFGYFTSKAARLPTADALAISVETGIQNTGIAIFLLRFSLPQPAADLTTVIPVSTAIMTPFPLMALYLVLKLREKNSLSFPDVQYARIS